MITSPLPSIIQKYEEENYKPPVTFPGSNTETHSFLMRAMASATFSRSTFHFVLIVKFSRVEELQAARCPVPNQ